MTHVLQGKNTLHEHTYDPYISNRKISDIYSVHCFLRNENCTSDFTEIIEIYVHLQYTWTWFLRKWQLYFRIYQDNWDRCTCIMLIVLGFTSSLFILQRLASAPIPFTVLSIMGNPCNEDYLAVTGLKVKIQIRVNEDNSGYQPIGLLQWFTYNFWLVGLPCVDLHKLWSGVWSPGSTPYPDLRELHHQTHLAAGNSDRAGHSHCRLCQGEQRAK